jgi:hypothetical protein
LMCDDGMHDHQWSSMTCAFGTSGFWNVGELVNRYCNTVTVAAAAL